MFLPRQRKASWMLRLMNFAAVWVFCNSTVLEGEIFASWFSSVPYFSVVLGCGTFWVGWDWISLSGELVEIQEDRWLTTRFPANYGGWYYGGRSLPTIVFLFFIFLIKKFNFPFKWYWFTKQIKAKQSMMDLAKSGHEVFKFFFIYCL